MATAIRLPVFEKSLGGGLPAIYGACVPHATVGRLPVGIATRESLPRAGVFHLPARRAFRNLKLATLDCPQVFEMPLRSGLPSGPAAVCASLQAGIALRESQPKVVVFPIPAQVGGSAKLKMVDRNCRPSPERFEVWIPSPAPEAVVRHVWPSTAPALRCEVALALPNLGGFAIAAEAAGIAAGDAGSLAPVEITRTESVNAGLQDPNPFQPIRMLPRSGCPALAGPQATPVESLFSSSALVPVPIAVTQELPVLRLMAFDLECSLVTTVAGHDSAIPRRGCPMVAGPVQSLIPSRSISSPIAVTRDVPALRLPGVEQVAGFLPSLGTSEISQMLQEPVQSPIPVTASPSPIAVAADAALRLPGVEHVGDLSVSRCGSGPCPTLPGPVQSFIRVSSATSHFAVTPDARALQLPVLAFSVGQVFDSASWLDRSRMGLAPTPAPGAVLSMSSRGPVPASPRLPAMALSPSMPGRLGVGATTLWARPADAPPPSPVESLPALAAFAPFRIIGVPATRLPQFPLPTGAKLSEAESEPCYPSTVAPEPQEPNPHAAVLKLISSVRVNPLDVASDRPGPVMPEPDFIPIEFYCQRGSVSPTRRLNWSRPPIDPAYPPFAMRIAVDRTEDFAPWKPAPKPPSHHEIPSLSDAARQRARARRMEQALKIAACLVMGVFLWFGAHELRNSGASGAPRIARTASAALPAGATPADGTSKGPVASVRRAIANRAAFTATDTLQTGMPAWGTAEKAWAPGWSRNPDGYAHTGELALFRPSLTFTDYRLEFFGQIENKSMGWVVRARDKENYYAMKFTVIEPGLRPVIAMAHYAVVAGRKGRKIEVPLSVMVHNNTPMHVAVDVQGNRVTASVEGQQVDSWTDDLLPAGGVGFFSEAGERARLYWMKVSKNQDWLGVICSYLSDSGGNSRETAEAWGLPMPAEIPAPGAPAQPQDVALAETEIGSRDFSGPQRARIWIQRRV
ncbi:MAG: hypothetical protein LAQ69_15165 [Acidobacteriia bacterium]|nr:hypothetical protein [Terriglobia bacterium]